jgi:hypothetical protein
MPPLKARNEKGTPGITRKINLSTDRNAQPALSRHSGADSKTPGNPMTGQFHGNPAGTTEVQWVGDKEHQKPWFPWRDLLAGKFRGIGPVCLVYRAIPWHRGFMVFPPPNENNIAPFMSGNAPSNRGQHCRRF